MSREGMIGRLPLALNSLSNDGLNEALALANLLGGNDGPAWIAYLKKVRKAGLPNQPQQETAPKPSLLRLLNDNVQLDGIDSHDPSQFYQTRTGLYIWGEFNSRVLSKAKPVSNLEPLSLSSYDLMTPAYDRDIKAALPTTHVFGSESELCARIAQMISKQPNGEEGNLLNNGYANLFYVAGCVVSVDWHVNAWRLGVSHWGAGPRVFSRN